VRITGGRFGGRTLAGPKDLAVRPTSDKVRQAVFNIIAHHEFETGFALDGARVIDLFAGTGAMGIEAVSRGAQFCLFVDEAAESRALLRANVEALQLTGHSKIWRRDATRLGAMSPGAGGPFELAFLDPPYRKHLLAPAMTSLVDGQWLAANALVVCECAEEEAAADVDGFTKLDERVYGDTRVVFYAFTSPSP
jgi:16S rRNA (guanine966-N2)-methyltransferase